MKELLQQTARVLVVGLCVAASAALVRGLPELGAGEAFCEAGGERVEQGPSGFCWIEQEEARSLSQASGAVFVDARPREAYEQGHIAGSLSYPAEPIQSGLQSRPESGALTPMLASAQTVVVYCDSGDQCDLSRRLAERLLGEGVHDVRVLRGGLPAWLANEYPAEAGPCLQCP